MTNTAQRSRRRFFGMDSRDYSLSWVVQVVILAAVYFGAAKFGLSLAFLVEQVSAVWPPTGISLAATLLLGYRIWPGIAIGAFLANVTTGEPIATAVGIACGNTLEAVAGAWLLRRLGFDPSLGRIRDVLMLAVLAAGTSSAVSATIGVTSLCLGGVQPWSASGTMWSVWWLGDVMGNLIMAPVLLVWRGGFSRQVVEHALEAAFLLISAVSITVWIFFRPVPSDINIYSLPYTIFPFLVWAALRFGQHGTTAITLVATSVAVCGTIWGHGPFGLGTVHERLVMLQVFMGVVAITALLLAAALAERRQSRDELQQNEARLKHALAELHQTDRRKDEFLALLGHELRNPLAPIRNGVEIMKLIGLNDPRLRDVRDMMERQVGQLSRLVDELLDVSRVSRGKITLDKQRVDLKEVTSCIRETCGPLLEKKRQELVVTLPATPRYVHADRMRLSQVFANLVGNASKFSDEGSRIFFEIESAGGQAVIRVRDEGIGIAPDMLTRIFDVFVQGDASLERSVGGLGIGLTLVHHLVELHGGSVQAFSAGHGKGSEFIVRLPLVPSQLPTSKAGYQLRGS